MKKTKTEKIFIDNGFGFPIILLNVPMILIRDIWTPNIDYKKLTSTVLKNLVIKPTRLTGNEIKFIRLTFEMTLKEFSERFYVTHPCVINWEKEKDNSTNMNWITEKDIRLFIFDKLSKEEDLRVIYEKLEKEPNNSEYKEPKFDVKKLELSYA
ncbi:MAG: hypothetical protein U0457_09795 [Candidatus Sericytochromatia bacterium]